MLRLPIKELNVNGRSEILLTYKASLAHPNDLLLGPTEARLVINVARSLLMYIDGKVGE